MPAHCGKGRSPFYKEDFCRIIEPSLTDGGYTMSKSMLRNETELERVARTHHQIALQAEVLASLEREIPNHIEKSDAFDVLMADTVLAENYHNPSECLAWLTASHRAWLKRNLEFNHMAGRMILHRYILLPDPSLFPNRYRNLLTNIILLHLQIQLWHGIVCGIVFLNPRTRNIAKDISDLNFVSIPSHRTFFDTPAFYKGGSPKTTILTDMKADARYRHAVRVISSRRSAPLWLHYDEENFSGVRLNGWRWEVLRKFFSRLYGPELFCTRCHVKLDKFALDHIAPVSKGYPQTIINFRPLCKKCNSEKGDIIDEDPYAVRLLQLSNSMTRELEDIHRQPPSWLGKIRSPSSLRDVTGKLSDG